MKFLKWGVCSILFLFCFVGAARPSVGLTETGPEAGEVLPWPWGTECMMDWNHLEGAWAFQRPGFSGTLRFRSEQVYQDLSVLMRIQLEDKDGRVYGLGFGVGQPNQPFMKARFKLVSKASGLSFDYWLILRSYKTSGGEGGIACDPEDRVTVATLRPQIYFGEKSPDIHLILDPMNFGSETKEQ